MHNVLATGEITASKKKYIYWNYDGLGIYLSSVRQRGQKFFGLVGFYYVCTVEIWCFIFSFYGTTQTKTLYSVFRFCIWQSKSSNHQNWKEGNESNLMQFFFRPDLVHISIFNMSMENNLKYYEFDEDIMMWINDNWDILQVKEVHVNDLFSFKWV